MHASRTDSANPANPAPIDLLITNARVFTADPAQPWAEAVAVRGNRIVFVGSRAEAAQLSQPRRTFDAVGNTVIPGLIDSHFHLQMGALRVEDLALEAVRDLAQLGTAVRRYAAEHPDKPWLSGHRLAYTVAGDRLLTRHDLDALEPNRPLALMSLDYHTVWANTPALAAAGILHGATVAPGSEVVMGPDGTATGQLNERDAFGLVLKVIPPPTAEQRRGLFRKALAEAASFGITSVHNLDGDAAQVSYYAELEAHGDLTLRPYVTYSVRPQTPFEQLAQEAAVLRDRHTGAQGGAHGGLLRCGSVKFFMDGVIDSLTAFMLEPYALPPQHCGEALWRAEAFNRFAVEADRLGLQIIVHAIGDAAVRRTLDGLAAARQANGVRDSRHRVEHIELLHPDDGPRFAGLGAVASMQPLHASRPERDHFTFWMQCVDRQRWGDAFPWQKVKAAGAPLIFGSDWPVVTMDPYAGLEAAVTRQPWAPGLPDQAVTLDEALLAYTRRAAWAEFQEHAKGRLQPGLLADLVVLDADLFACAAPALAQVRPLLTMCDGRVVYER